MAFKVSHQSPNLIYKSAVRQMEDGHFIFASSEEDLCMFGSNPRAVSQVQKVWFIYEPEVFSIWERTLNLSNGNMNCESRKGNNTVWSFPIFLSSTERSCLTC